MRDVKGAHELSSDASRRRKWNEVQEAVQPHNKKDHACKISSNYRSNSHNRVVLSERRKVYDVNNLDVNRIDAECFYRDAGFFMTRGAQGTDRVWTVMMKAMRALTKYAAADIEGTGLGLTDFCVLERLLHNGPAPVNALGPMVDLTP